MTYLRLPVFNRGVRVEAGRALQDKIQLNIGGWRYRADYADINFLLLQMNERHHRVPGNTDGGFRNFFAQATPKSPADWDIRIVNRVRRQEDLGVLGKPLIAGKICFRQIQSYDPSSDQARFSDCQLYSITARLTINPTRMLFQQNLLRLRNNEDFVLPNIELLSRRGLGPGYNEVSLDGNDNVLLSPLQHKYSKPLFWQRYRNQYFRAIESFIHDELQQEIASSDSIQLFYTPRISLKNVETYWEFQSEDPVRDIRAIQHKLQLLGDESLQQEYPCGTRGNSPTLSANLAPGTRLVIYAKTSRRIRFEVRHSLAIACRRRDLPRSHVSTNMEGMIELINSLAEDAANLLNEALSLLDQYLPVENDETSEMPYKLVWEIMKAVDDDYRTSRSERLNRQEQRELNSKQQALLSIIVNNNVYRTVDNDSFAPELRRLKRRSVMVGDRREYRLARRYQQARVILSDFPEESPAT